MDLENVKGVRKAAALCVLLGEDVSSRMFKHLWEDEIEKISKEISVLHSIPSELADLVLEEYHNLAVARQYISTGGIEYTKKLLNKALGPEGSKRVLERVARSLESAAGFNALERADPQQLSRFIANENPQTIALILAHLDPVQGAELLSSFPENVRPDIVMRMANLGEISPEVIKRISLILNQKLTSLGDYNAESIGGQRAVAELVNKMDRADGRAILEKIENEDAELALAIRNLMVVFEDIMLVDNVGIREILQRVDKKTLTVALKGTNEQLQAHIFKNMSQRAVEMMKEDMEALGPVRIRDVEKAQHEIVEILQKLEEEGVINIRGGGGDEYVV
ncbi:MAG: flagellar motor switch protein FliG [Acidobacteriota bacterium]